MSDRPGELMISEMREQSRVIRQLVRRERSAALELGASILERGIRQIVIVARGTSDNAAIYGKYLIECTLGIPVALAAPSVVTLYGAKLRLEDALVIGISQSGQGADVVAYIEAARSGGSMTVSVTNTPDSPLAAASDVVLDCGAGKELALAATKTYTSELAALVMLAWGMGAQWRGSESSGCASSLADELMRCADVVDEVFALDASIRTAAATYSRIESLIVLARGINHATAMEVALKLQETCYVGAKGFSGADFLHGPFALVEEGCPVLVFAAGGRGGDALLPVVEKLVTAGADTVVFSDDVSFSRHSKTFLEMPRGRVNELISPIPYAVAGQLFAYHLALAMGLNPDKPRGLKKVTSTM